MKIVVTVLPSLGLYNIADEPYCSLKTHMFFAFSFEKIIQYLYIGSHELYVFNR